MMYQINNFADEAQPWVRSCGILDGHRGSRERERERERVCLCVDVCVCKRERECVCFCVGMCVCLGVDYQWEREGNLRK